MADIIRSEDAPIEFFGKVVDAAGSPVEGAELAFHIVKAGSFAPSLGFPTGEVGNVRTAPDGRFEIIGKQGMTLGFDKVVKAGFHEAERMIRTFGYGNNAAPHRPDKAAPELFVLIRDGSSVSQQGELNLAFDWKGEALRFKLPLKGVEETLVLTPSREPAKPPARSYNWNLKVELDGGQVVMGTKGIAPIAPTEGYLPGLTVNGDPKGTRWTSTADILFYFKTKSGGCGQIKLKVYSDRDSTSRTGSLDVSFNPDGSRVFE
ncbi:hypothetical protein [Luteolibacter sp. Populi]|uniref:hypothetical protein n=1 Tax=Luteolibacter sp. Populi TaxID=3230487 RepID=UPI00346654F7